MLYFCSFVAEEKGVTAVPPQLIRPRITPAPAPPSPHSAFNFRLLTIDPLSPLPATLIDPRQLNENAATLSPASATLTRSTQSKPFVCHSYRKHWGGGAVQFSRYSSRQPKRFPLFPQPAIHARTGTPATPFLSSAYFTVPWIPGGGGHPLQTSPPHPEPIPHPISVVPIIAHASNGHGQDPNRRDRGEKP